MPDLVCRLLPGLAAAGPGDSDNPAATDPSFSSGTETGIEPERQTAYVFQPVALKKVAHHPDGVLWPRQQPGGSEASGGASGGADACRSTLPPPAWR